MIIAATLKNTGITLNLDGSNWILRLFSDPLSHDLLNYMMILLAVTASGAYQSAYQLLWEQDRADPDLHSVWPRTMGLQSDFDLVGRVAYKSTCLNPCLDFI